MRLSPSFSANLPDYAARPSIPLEPISLGTLKYAPPKLEIKPTSEVKPPSLPHQQSVDISTFFKQSSQPKPSLPTLSHPKIKVTPISHPVLKKLPTPTPNKTSPPPIQKLPLVEKHNIFALKKVIQSMLRPHDEIKKMSPPVQAHEPEMIKVPTETKPITQPQVETKSPVTEPISELKALNDQLKAILDNPIFHASLGQAKPPHPTSQPIKPILPANEAQPIAEKKPPTLTAILQPEPNIQELISEELKKVIPATPQPPLEIKKTSPPHSQIHPFQKPSFPATVPFAKQQNHPQIYPLPPTSPKSPTLAAVHFWDYFLIRVNPKLNPYKSPTRGWVILGIKISGLVLLALGAFIISSIFVTSISLNVIFEAISTLTISGILLFLGENLNMFFEPFNPYKIREVV